MHYLFGKLTALISGNCILVITAEQKHYVSMDTVRATIDVLLSTCLDGPDCPRLGGWARAQPLSASNGTSSTGGDVSIFRRGDAHPESWILDVLTDQFNS